MWAIAIAIIVISCYVYDNLLQDATNSTLFNPTCYEVHRIQHQKLRTRSHSIQHNQFLYVDYMWRNCYWLFVAPCTIAYLWHECYWLFVARFIAKQPVSQRAGHPDARYGTARVPEGVGWCRGGNRNVVGWEEFLQFTGRGAHTRARS